MLSAKRKRFVAEYLIDLNATQAAIRAGYSPKTAMSQGPRLLSNAEVQAAVQAGKARQLEKAELSAEAVLEAIRRVVMGDIRRLFDEHGNCKPIHQLTADEAALIAGYEVVLKNAEAGDGVVDRVLKLKLKDHAKYVEMAAKHYALLVERVDLAGQLEITWKSAE